MSTTHDRSHLLRWIGISLVVHLVVVVVTSVPWLIGLVTAEPEPVAATAAAPAPAPAATAAPATAPAATPAAPAAAPLPEKPTPRDAQDVYLDSLPEPTADDKKAAESFRPDLDALR